MDHDKCSAAVDVATDGAFWTQYSHTHNMNLLLLELLLLCCCGRAVRAAFEDFVVTADTEQVTVANSNPGYNCKQLPLPLSLAAARAIAGAELPSAGWRPGRGTG